MLSIRAFGRRVLGTCQYICDYNMSSNAQMTFLVMINPIALNVAKILLMFVFKTLLKFLLNFFNVV